MKHTELTDQELAMKALHESEERYRAAIEAVNGVVWTNTSDGLMEGEQWDWENFTGQSREVYQGYGWSKAIHPLDAQATIEAWNQAVAEQRLFTFEHRLRRYDGEWRICSIRAVPVFNGDGRIREWVGVHTDITEQRRDEEKLRELATQLSEADRQKDAFLATLAHELRNPLAPIRNGLELLKLANGHQIKIERLCSIMDRQLSQMVHLIDDLMDVSRIGQNKLKLRNERVHLATVLENAVANSRHIIEQMGHKLTVAIPKQAAIIEADITRLEQAFLNLLHNAAKYSTPGGHLELSVELNDSDAVVTVKDSGIGIAADQLTRIFEMFTQVDSSFEKSHGGLGVGLSLVKRLVEMHGGNVIAKSEGVGKGSEFVVTLPLAKEALQLQENAKEPESTVTLVAECRILVVDDNRDAADSLSEMLTIMGNNTKTAYDGKEAVEMASVYQPDVILLDIGMPKLNGYDACRLIRQQPWCKNALLIALTGWGQDEDRRRSKEAGFDHHLIKPLNPQELFKLLG